MRRHASLLVLFALLFLPAAGAFSAAAGPPSDVRNLNTPRDFPKITTQGEWQERAREIREQILVSSGLWPLPEKTPLHAVVFGKIVRDGYSVEKVYFQTYPGFYLAGNLYRPAGRGNGPFPAILNPHGHWDDGRLTDTAVGSIPGRCINFARQGMIAFSYDMVGYNDTHFPESPAKSSKSSFYKIHSNFATNDPADLLWSVSLMGLQTWNSVRALDFLESLPDADPHRLACTGASGGGTQTFILGAIDDRLAAQAPVVMVSHTMQGGCGCENMPGLRIEFSNMEIAAAAAPRPQIFVGASGDWTKTMLTIEGPAVEHIYQLFNAPENLRYVRFDFPHNYNQTSREAVYQWFDKCLLAQPDVPVKELAFQKEPDQDLRVFPDGKLPPDALSQQDLIKYLIATRRARLQALQPHDFASWQNYRLALEPAWRRTLHQESNPRMQTEVKFSPIASEEDKPRDYTAGWQEIKSEGDEAALKVLYFASKPSASEAHPARVLVVLADPQGGASFTDATGAPKGLARLLLDKHFDVAVMEQPAPPAPDQTSILFNTYNLTFLQTQVKHIVSACEGIRAYNHTHQVVLCGTARAGLWCLLATPAADAVIADCAQLDVSDDHNLLAPDLFCPGLRNIDTFIGAPAIAAPHPLMLHNVAGSFPLATLRSTYKASKVPDKFQSESHRLTDKQIVAWISKMK